MSESAKDTDNIRELIRNDMSQALTLIYDLLGGKLFGYVLLPLVKKSYREFLRIMRLYPKACEKPYYLAREKEIEQASFAQARSGNPARWSFL